jgi:hypothetical protein
MNAWCRRSGGDQVPHLILNEDVRAENLHHGTLVNAREEEGVVHGYPIA